MKHEEEFENFVGSDLDPEDDEDLFASDEYDDFEDECYECDGTGFRVRDCEEDTCCCADPETQHGIEPCPACNPGGTR